LVSALAVTRKEIRDAASNRVFLLCTLILTVSMLFAGASAANSYRTMLTDPGIGGIANRMEFFKRILMENITPQIETIGVLVAVVLSFNSINKEREEGSLKVLLSYPIYRNQVALGKLLGGFLTLGVVVSASMAVALAVFALNASVLLTIDFLSRFAVAVLVTLLYLSFYLGLGLASSIVFREVKMSLLVVFVIVGVVNFGALWMFLVVMLPELLFGFGFTIVKMGNGVSLVPNNPMTQTLSVALSWLVPPYHYELISVLLMPNVRNSTVNGVAFAAPISLLEVLSENVGSLAVLAISFSIMIIICYMLFMNRDIT
jgi:ABC-2 type transport system permease protein